MVKDQTANLLKPLPLGEQVELVESHELDTPLICVGVCPGKRRHRKVSRQKEHKQGMRHLGCETGGSGECCGWSASSRTGATL
jgi:hypothetical protein